jgi:hypothetical protein
MAVSYQRIGCGGQCPVNGVDSSSIGFIPNQNKLIAVNSSVKVAKGIKKKYDTGIVYLSPYWSFDGSHNLCPSASAGCRSTCLVTSGQLKNPTPKQSQLDKTNFWLSDPNGFLSQAHKEIESLVRTHSKKGANNFTIRLNGTSDIPFEKKSYTYKGIRYNSIMEAFPNVQFYDYTKIYDRLGKTPANYHLTFSASETNTAQWNEALKRGFQVAMVFGSQPGKVSKATGKYIKKPDPLPKEYHGYKVVDGDDTDLTFLRENGVIIGLRMKGKAENDTTGFVKRDFKQANKNYPKLNPKTNIPNIISKRSSKAEKPHISMSGYSPFDAETTDLNSLSRLELIEWLMYNDKNGSYTDKEAKQQGFKPLTKKEAIELVKNQSMGSTKVGAYKRKTLTKDQKQYNKDVDAYNWFVVSDDGYVATGYEYKSDAIDTLKEYNEYPYQGKHWKVISLRTLKTMGLNDPRETWKDKVGATKSDLSIFNDWIEDGNVSYNGTYYSTQDAQFNNRLSEEGLIEYYFKEFKGMKLKKGSKEAKAYMAKLRARKGKVGKIDFVNRRATTTYVHVSRKPKVRKSTGVKRVVNRVEKTTLMPLRNLQIQDTFTLGKAGRTIYERGYKVANKDAYECFTLAGKKVIQKGSVKVNLIDESGISGYVHTKKRGTKSTLKYTHPRAKMSGGDGMHTDTNSHNYKITIGAVNQSALRDYEVVTKKVGVVEKNIIDLQLMTQYNQYPKAKVFEMRKAIAMWKKYLKELKTQKAELKKLL